MPDLEVSSPNRAFPDPDAGREDWQAWASNYDQDRISDNAGRVHAVDANKLGEASHFRNSLASLGQLRSRFQSFQGDLDPNNVRIGMTSLEVPPEHISISTQAFDNPEVPTLRSTTNSLIKSGRGRILISMNLLFPDVRALNTELRSLVAQFRLSPILPLYSSYVSNALHPRVLPEKKDASQPNPDDGIRNKELEVRRLQDANKKDIISIGEQVKLLTDISGLDPDDTDNDISVMVNRFTRLARDGASEIGQEIILESINNLRDLINDTNELARNQSMPDYFYATLKNVIDIYVRIQDRTQRIRTMKSNREGTDNGMSELKSDVVPVILEELSFNTIDSDSEAIAATLTVRFFNHKPYSKFFEFKDAIGLPTDDIRECPWYQKYISMGISNPKIASDNVSLFENGRRWLKPITVDTTSGVSERGHFGLRYPTTRLLRTDQVQRIGASDLRTTKAVKITVNDGTDHFVNTFSTPVIRDNNVGYINEYKDFFVNTGDENIIIENIQIHLNNVLAEQPILGSIYPTYQYTGGMNARIIVGLCVTGSDQEEYNEALSALTTIKRETERVAVMYGPRARRDSKVLLSNELANLIGVHAVQLENMEILTDGPLKSRVTMSMIEYTSSPTENEALASNKGKLHERIRALIEWGAPRALEIANKWRSRKILASRMLGAGTPEELFRTLRAGELIPGVDDTLLGVLYRDALGAGFHVNINTDPKGFFLSDPTFRAEANRLRKVMLATADPLSERVKKLKELRQIYSALVKSLREQVGLRDQLNLQSARLKKLRVYQGLLEYVKVAESSLDSASNYFYFNRGSTLGDVLLTRPEERDLTDGDVDRDIAIFTKKFDQGIRSAGIDAVGANRAMIELDSTLRGIGRSGDGNLDFNDPQVRRRIDTFYPTAISLNVLKYAIMKIDSLVEKIRANDRSMTGFINNVERYASLLLLYWSGQIIAEHPKIKTFRAITTQDIDFPPTAADPLFLEAIIEVYKELHERQTITLSSHIPADSPPAPSRQDLQSAYEAVVWAEGHYPEFARLLSEESEVNNVRTAHPDLALPTYGEVYREVFDILGVEPDSSTNLNDLDTFQVQILKRFMPTYHDLGIRNPESRDIDDIARTATDEVEPGFFWYHERTLTTASFQQTVQAAEIVQETIHRDKQTSPRKGKVLFDASGSLKTRSNPAIDIDVADYAPAIRQAIQSIGAIDIDSAEHAKGMLEEAIRDKKDDVFSMRRAYPGFKVYFVEPNNQGIAILDDLYGYNAIKGIKVHRHVFYPDTLELDLVNISGNLDVTENTLEDRLQGEVQRLSQEAGIAGVYNNESRVSDTVKQLQSNLAGLQSKPLIDPLTGRKAVIDNLFLREGTMVVIKMGYTNRPVEMETVFTGQIAEIIRGDVMKMVAQGYGSQLTVPVNKKEANGPLDAIASVMRDEAPVHFGTVKVNIPEFKAEKDARRARYRGLQNNDSDDILFRTRRLDNVFLTSIGHNYKFRIPNKIGLEVLDEVTRHFPGMVFGVRPYDNNATLFFGYPSQPYRYTNKGLHDELQDIAKLVRFRKNQYLIPKQRDIEDSLLAARLLGRFSGITVGNSGDKEYIAWKDSKSGFNLGGLIGLQDFVYPEAPLELSLAAARYIDDSFFVGGYVLKDSTDRRIIWDRLVEKLGIGVMRAVVRMFFNDIHWLSTNRPLRHNPVLFRGSSGAEGASAWNIFGVVAGKGVGSTAETIAEGFDALGTDISNLLRDEVDQRDHRDYAVDGSKLVALPDWLQRVRGLLKPVKEMNEEEIAKDILRKGDGARSVDNIDIPDWSEATKRISRYSGAFRGFLYAFDLFISRIMIADDSDDVDLLFIKQNSARDRTPRNKLKPGYRAFRRYHWVDSDRHIIRNNIRVTVDEMANVAQVRYPESISTEEDDTGMVSITSNPKWKSFELQFHKHQRPQDKRQRVYTEINADSKDRAESCGLSNLARSVSTMYRGELVIQGDARIEPHDVVFVFDWYNLVFGPIEVEAVTHVFLPVDGFATIIQPRALVIPGRSADLKQAVAEATIAIKYVGDINLRQADGLLRSRSNDDEEEEKKKKIRYQSNLDLLPLTFNGRPWYAGLRGFDEDWFGLDVEDRWDLWREGAAQIARSRLFSSRGD